jgi:cell division protein FtsI (penicillin-binding protein 3)
MKPDRRRVYVLIAIMGAWSATIGARLFFLQVVRSADYREKAENQQLKGEQITAPRGAIYDRNGNQLAYSIKVDSVAVNPREIKDGPRTAQLLSSLTGVPTAELLKRFDSNKYFAWVKRKISPAEAEAIAQAVAKHKLSGINFQKEYQRYYPKGETAAHVLGYVNSDEKGGAGLEYRYDDKMRGVNGTVKVMTDARQATYGRIEVDQPPQAGANLVTTLDENIQYIVEKEIAEAAERTHAASISVSVMDPHTGQMLAVANYPTFNPNQYNAYSPESQINRAVASTYEPGSTFKIATASAAIEEGLVTLDELIDCQLGSISIAGHKIHDWKPFGWLTVGQILQNSSDVGAIQLGIRLGKERFADYIQHFGFGRPTGIDLPGEEHGTARPASRWSNISIGAISMGQEITVTPLQILGLVSAVANGGILYRPYVVQKVQHPEQGVLSETEPHGERIMSQTTAEKLQSMLEVVVTDGTAKTSKLEGYRAAGKTGTAQKVENGRYSQSKYVASFAGFAPVSNPAIAMIVVIDSPVGAHHGGDVAAPVFKKIAEQILRFKIIAPDVPEYAPKYKAPSNHDRKPDDGKGLVNQPDWKIVEAGVHTTAPTESVDGGAIVVPDFHGRSKRDVTAESFKLGIELISSGSGLAVAQNPQPGARVSTGGLVKVTFAAK